MDSKLWVLWTDPSVDFLIHPKKRKCIVEHIGRPTGQRKHALANDKCHGAGRGAVGMSARANGMRTFSHWYPISMWTDAGTAPNMVTPEQYARTNACLCLRQYCVGLKQWCHLSCLVSTCKVAASTSKRRSIDPLAHPFAPLNYSFNHLQVREDYWALGFSLYATCE